MTLIAATAQVDPTAVIGSSTKIWDLAQVRERARIGAECVIGRAAYVGPGVRVGNRVKIQNLAQVYEPASVADGVFIGPAVVLTNDQYPRAVTPGGELASPADWRAVGVTVNEGASLGARSVCVAPVVVGRWALVAAGAVVVKDVPDFALVAGTPARFVGWVGRAGRRLVRDGEGWRCPVTHARYTEHDGLLEELQP